MAFAGRRALLLYKKTEPRGLGLLNVQIFELLLKRCDFHSPTEGIFYLTGLDAGDGVVQLLAEFADAAVLDLHDFVLVTECADRGDNGCGTATPALFKCTGTGRLNEFVNGDSSLFDRETPVLAEIDAGCTGNARQNTAVQHRGDNGAVDFEEDVHSTDFFDVLALNTVEPQNLRVTFVVCLYLCREACNVVAAGLCFADAAADCTYIVVFDPNLYRVEAALVVSADRGKNDDEFIGVRRAYAEERIRCNDERTNIKRSAGAARNPICVNGDERLDRIEEIIGRDLRDAKSSVGVVCCLLYTSPSPRDCS